MGELNYYSEKDKKEAFKDYQIICTARDFDNWYSNTKGRYNGENFIFRGVPEARYKLYNSAQRLWWQRDFARSDNSKMSSKYLEFLQMLLKYAKNWNNYLLPKFYSNLNIDINDFALFSLMQHYGIPTPLLDFSTDLDIGLYFAFFYAGLEPSNDYISNFVSLYIINLDANNNFLTDAKGQKLSLELIYNQQKLCVFTEVKESDMSDNKSSTTSFTNTNFNIINQKGLFLFNHHPWMPIEMSYKTLGNPPSLNEIICIDFHKSFKEHVLYELKSKGIIKEFLFADFNQFQNFVQTSTLENFSL